LLNPAPVAIVSLKIEKLDIGIRVPFPTPICAAWKGFAVKLRPWIPDRAVIAGKRGSVSSIHRYHIRPCLLEPTQFKEAIKAFALMRKLDLPGLSTSEELVWC